LYIILTIISIIRIGFICQLKTRFGKSVVSLDVKIVTIFIRDDLLPGGRDERVAILSHDPGAVCPVEEPSAGGGVHQVSIAAKS
jgi:hypothetical protein